jgi:hypothetical protein
MAGQAVHGGSCSSSCNAAETKKKKKQKQGMTLKKNGWTTQLRKTPHQQSTRISSVLRGFFHTL